VDLDPISKMFTGTVNADIPKVREGRLDLSAGPSLEDVVERAKPAVIRLKGLAKSGSGFLVTEKGVIATNAHLARGENSLLVLLAGGQQLTAKMVHIDPDRDIALLKVDGDDFPRLTLAATSTVRSGETVIAVGNPGGGMPFTVTKGIVSAVGKFSAAGPGIWIQTDASLNPGYRGGPAK